MRVRVAITLIIISVFRALGRECPHELLNRLGYLLWEQVSCGGLPPLIYRSWSCWSFITCDKLTLSVWTPVLLQSLLGCQ